MRGLDQQGSGTHYLATQFHSSEMELPESPNLSSVSGGGLNTPQEVLPVFHYDPLDRSVDSIRLVTLHPRRSEESDQVIQCELIHSNFLSKPKYEALSYTWGSPEPEKSIFLNGIQVSVKREPLLGLVLSSRTRGQEYLG